MILESHARLTRDLLEEEKEEDNDSPLKGPAPCASLNTAIVAPKTWKGHIPSIGKIPKTFKGDMLMLIYGPSGKCPGVLPISVLKKVAYHCVCLFIKPFLLSLSLPAVSNWLPTKVML